MRSVFLPLQTGKVLVVCVLGGFAKSPRRSWRRNHLLTRPFRTALWQEGPWLTRGAPCAQVEVGWWRWDMMLELSRLQA